MHLERLSCMYNLVATNGNGGGRGKVGRCKGSPTSTSEAGAGHDKIKTDHF